MTTDRRLLDLVPAYVLGALEGEELRELETALEQGNAELEREIAAFGGSIEALAREAEPIEPLDATKEALLSQLPESSVETPAEEPQAQEQDQVVEAFPAPPSKPSGQWGQRLAAVLAIGLAVSLWQFTALRSELRELEAEREKLVLDNNRLQGAYQAAQSDLVRLEAASRVVTAERTQTVLLAGLEASPDSRANLYLDPDSLQAAFYTSGLAALEDSQDYQLWFIADGTPVSAGVFQVDETGKANLLVQKAAAPNAIQAWAVTIEPKGGVDQPSGTMVLKS